MDCALSSAAFSASGVAMFGFAAPARTATPRPTRATSSVGPAANRARAAASCITSAGTTPRSNGLADVASLIRFGVVPKKISSLWPEACSNFGFSSPHTAVIEPPVRTRSSAADAAGASAIASPIVAAMENVFIAPSVGAPAKRIGEAVARAGGR